MKFDKPRRWVPKTYWLDVTMILENKSNHPEDRRKMTDAQIAINTHRCCPHFIALSDATVYPQGPYKPNDYLKQKITCIAKVINAKSSGSAIDIVSTEVTSGCLDRHYIVRSVNVKARRN